MKPLQDLYEEAISLDHLFSAAAATLSRGRRFRDSGVRYVFALEWEIFRLREALRTGTYRHGRYTVFAIRDPKPRLIAAASMRDRVVHHAVHDLIEPRLDRMFIYDSYACRRGKGTHQALDRAHHFLRAGGYALHLDVRQYFANIDHDILKRLLTRYVADEKLLNLLVQIIDSTRYLAEQGGAEAAGGAITTRDTPLDLAGFPMESETRYRGLPLGNLTSQFFANLYLNELDQVVKHQLKMRRYVRYMDDLVLFLENKDRLRECEEHIRAFAAKHLKLRFHESGGPSPTSCGLSFLGFRLYPTHRRLLPTAIRRFAQRTRLQTVEYFALSGKRAAQAEHLRGIRRSATSFNGHAAHGNTWRLRERLYNRFIVISPYWFGMKRRSGVHGVSAGSGEELRSGRLVAGPSPNVSPG